MGDIRFVGSSMFLYVMNYGAHFRIEFFVSSGNLGKERGWCGWKPHLL